MSQFPQTRRIPLDYSTDSGVTFSFFNAVYAWMSVGLAVTAAVAWYVNQTPALQNLFNGGIGFVVFVFLAMWGIAIAVQTVALRMSAALGITLFLVYAILMGGLLSFLFKMYSLPILGGAFIITGGTFASMSIYGFITKRDLSRMGSFLIMAFIGLIIASFVNLFMRNDFFSWIITYGVLAVFIGLTAYETQRLKVIAEQLRGNQQMLGRVAVVGSLILYISFINMFLSIVRILGRK